MFSFRKLIQKKFPGKKVVLNKDFYIESKFIFDRADTSKVETSLENSIIRPFRRLIEEQKPVGRINNVFYFDKNTEKHHVVGSFCHTSYATHQKRLIFFPGIRGRKFLWHSDELSLLVGKAIDHLTVEPNLDTWHYTFLEGGKKIKTRLPSNKLWQVQKGLTYWFGMSISNPGVMETLYKEYRFKFRLQGELADEASEHLLQARKASRHHVVFQNDSEADTRSEFIHFDFLIDRRWFRSLRKLPLNTSLVPTGEKVRSDKLENEKTFPVRAHHVKIEDFKGDVLVLVSKHKGKLSQDVIIGGAKI